MKIKKYFYLLCLFLLCATKIWPQPNAGCNNANNSCFLNATVQALFHTKPLRDFLETNKDKYPKDSAPDLLYNHIEAMDQKERKKKNDPLLVVNPAKFRVAVTTHRDAPPAIKPMSSGQHDAQEFLLHLLTEIETGTKDHAEIKKQIEQLFAIQSTDQEKLKNSKKLAESVWENFLNAGIMEDFNEINIKAWFKQVIQEHEVDDLEEQLFIKMTTVPIIKNVLLETLDFRIKVGQEVGKKKKEKKQETIKFEDLQKSLDIKSKNITKADDIVIGTFFGTYTKTLRKLLNFTHQDYEDFIKKIDEKKDWHTFIDYQKKAKEHQQKFANIFTSAKMSQINFEQTKNPHQLGALLTSNAFRNEKQPKILIIWLARFADQHNKNTDPVTFDTSLDMSSYGDNTIYNLYAIVIQSGTLAGGHYYTYAKWGNDWWKYDDASVTHVDNIKDVTEQRTEVGGPYLLFYERIQTLDDKIKQLKNALETLKKSLIKLAVTLQETKKKLVS